MQQRPPDYIMKAMDLADKTKKDRVGAAWLNEDGSISIILDRFVSLNGSYNISLRLFTNDKKS